MSITRPILNAITRANTRAINGEGGGGGGGGFVYRWADGNPNSIGQYDYWGNSGGVRYWANSTDADSAIVDWNAIDGTECIITTDAEMTVAIITVTDFGTPTVFTWPGALFVGAGDLTIEEA